MKSLFSLSTEIEVRLLGLVPGTMSPLTVLFVNVHSVDCVFSFVPHLCPFSVSPSSIMANAIGPFPCTTWVGTQVAIFCYCFCGDGAQTEATVLAGGAPYSWTAHPQGSLLQQILFINTFNQGGTEMRGARRWWYSEIWNVENADYALFMKKKSSSVKD